MPVNIPSLNLGGVRGADPAPTTLSGKKSGRSEGEAPTPSSGASYREGGRSMREITPNQSSRTYDTMTPLAHTPGRDRCEVDALRYKVALLEEKIVTMQEDYSASLAKKEKRLLEVIRSLGGIGSEKLNVDKGTQCPPERPSSARRPETARSPAASRTPRATANASHTTWTSSTAINTGVSTPTTGVSPRPKGMYFGARSYGRPFQTARGPGHAEDFARTNTVGSPSSSRKPKPTHAVTPRF